MGELTEVCQIEADSAANVEQAFERVLARIARYQESAQGTSVGAGAGTE